MNSETSVFLFAINLPCKLMFWILHNLGNYQAIFWHSRNLFCKLLLWIMGLCEFCNNNHCISFSSNQTFFWTIFFPILLFSISFSNFENCGFGQFFVQILSPGLICKLSFRTTFLEVVNILCFQIVTVDHATKKNMDFFCKCRSKHFKKIVALGNFFFVNCWSG